jgi:hypothetical protein
MGERTIFVDEFQDDWNNSPRVDMSLHSDTLFWFWANQSFLLLLNAACLAEKQQIPCNFIVFDFTLSGLEPTIYPLEANMFNANSVCQSCDQKSTNLNPKATFDQIRR